MKKSFKEAFKHTKNNSKSIWNILWALLNFLWLLYCTLQIKGQADAAELVVNKLFLGILPFITSLICLFAYHFIRSDLYLEISKPSIGKSIIPGLLLRMVEHWSPNPIKSHFTGPNQQCKAYWKLNAYRTSYEFDSIHNNLDEFMSAFVVSGHELLPSIKTKFNSKEEAAAAFPRLKELVKEISKVIT